MTRASSLICAFLFCASLASAQTQSPSLIPLPIRPTCISRDGVVIAGDDGASTPMFWTASTGAKRLFGPSGEKWDGHIWAANANGSVLVGLSHFGNLSNDQGVFVWSAKTGMVSLGAGYSESYGITDDGNTVAIKTTTDPLPRLWHRDSGFEYLPLPDNATSGHVLGISGDGKIAIGQVSNDLAALIPAKWHLDDGTIELFNDGEQYFPAGFGIRASRDGSVVGAIVNQVEHMYWTTNGFIDFGVGTPWGLSSDGRIAVGRPALFYTPGLGPTNIRAFVASMWTIDVSEWTPSVCTGVSGDGLTVVGFGGLKSSDGWLLRLPPRPPGDFNCDWFTDIFDLNAFVDCFENQSVLPANAADLDGDGFVDIFDFQRFIEEFEGG